MEFSDLPQLLGAKIYQVLKTGSAISSFKYEPEDAPGTIYNINIVPFQRQQAGLPASALLMAEDLTQSEQLQRLEIEAANLRLVKTMADRLTHEIGNAMVPLSTHQQLLADKWKDPEFRASLDVALADGVKRVTRLINQMRFLARDALASQEAFPLAPLIEEAYQEACKHQSAKAAQLKYDTGSKPIVLTGDRAALEACARRSHAERPAGQPRRSEDRRPPPDRVQWQRHRGLQIEVQDNGAGFTPEAVQKAPVAILHHAQCRLGPRPDRQPQNHRNPPRQTGDRSAQDRPGRRGAHLPAAGYGRDPAGVMVSPPGHPTIGTESASGTRRDRDSRAAVPSGPPRYPYPVVHCGVSFVFLLVLSRCFRASNISAGQYHPAMNARVLRFRWFIRLGGVGLACSVFIARVDAADRKTFSLDGQWQIEESVSATNQPQQFKHKAPVPGLANLAVPAFPNVDQFDSQELVANRSAEAPAGVGPDPNRRRSTAGAELLLVPANFSRRPPTRPLRCSRSTRRSSARRFG